MARISSMDIFDLNKPHSITEFRIVLPMTVEQYQIGQLWTTAEVSKNQTGGGDGVEILVNEPFNETVNKPANKLMCNGKVFTEGQFSGKIYHMARKAPGWVRLLIPSKCMEFKEYSWNAYPYTRTVITNPKFMQENFYVVIESYHAPDNGSNKNIHGLTGHDLANRKVVLIDIANDPVLPKDYNPDWDPTLSESDGNFRAAIPKDGTGLWMSKLKPVMCCYKIVKVWFKWFGMQKKMESYIMKQEYRLFFLFHRQIYCWQSNYKKLTLADVRKIEDEVKADLIARLQSKSVQGIAIGED